jgi:hypothetical protein
MKRVTGYLVLVVSFIMIIFLSIDQPCMLDIIPGSPDDWCSFTV